MSESEFMEKVNAMAESNLIIKRLLADIGHPDIWPSHLRDDLYKMMGIKTRESIYLINESKENQ